METLTKETVDRIYGLTANEIIDAIKTQRDFFEKMTTCDQIDEIEQFENEYYKMAIDYLLMHLDLESQYKYHPEDFDQDPPF